MDDPLAKPDDPKALADRVQRLERELVSLRQSLMEAGKAHATANGALGARIDDVATRTAGPHPLRPFFLATVTATSGSRVAFKEQYVNDTGLVDFTAGRVVSDETGDFVAIIPGEDVGLVIAYEVPGGIRYAMFQGGGSGTVVVKVASDATGGGFYNGYIMSLPSADVDGTTDLAASDIGLESEACLIENMMEVGKSTHDLTNAANTYQFYFIGHVRRTNEDGVKVVAINGFFTGCEAT